METLIDTADLKCINGNPFFLEEVFSLTKLRQFLINLVMNLVLIYLSFSIYLNYKWLGKLVFCPFLRT